MLKIVDIAGTAASGTSTAPYTEVPPLANVLTPRVIAPVGGQTEFANTYTAFEGLPAEEQEYLMTLEVVHSMKAAFNQRHARADVEPSRDTTRIQLDHETVEAVP